VRTAVVLRLARECGFELAGIAPALPLQPEAAQFLDWVARGLAGRMSYLTDHRADIRTDPRKLLPSARSILSVGRIYNVPQGGPISRYARSEDYHDVLRKDLERLASLMRDEFGDFECRICVDTAPLLERSYARAAGLGWIGRNTCLINQEYGSYVFLAEMLTSLELDPGIPAPDRCGTCMRCIEACPTEALIPGGLRTELDATRCISYLTIELKGDIPEELRSATGALAFGCDICQEVCPWNNKAPFADSRAGAAMGLEELAELSEADFRRLFRNTPVWRTKYRGLLRNVAVALGNEKGPRSRLILEKLAQHDDSTVRTHAEWALRQLD
jgi:epoxyqueuosine reductase